MEERVTKLETHVEHIRTDIAEIKVDIRRLGDRIDGVDQKLTAKIDGVDQKLTAKIDAVDQKLSVKIDDLRIGRVYDRVWYLLMSAALLGIMGRAFKWI